MIRRDGRLLVPAENIQYPPGKDELIAAVKSQDPTREGWVGMPVLEATEDGFTETVRNATSLNFLIPRGYGIEDAEVADVRMCFRNSKSLGEKTSWDYHLFVIPPQSQDTGSKTMLKDGITTQNGYRAPFVAFMMSHLREPRPFPYDRVYEWARGMETNRQGMRGCVCQQRFLQTLDYPGEWKQSLQDQYDRLGMVLAPKWLDETSYGGSPAPAREPESKRAPAPKQAPPPILPPSAEPLIQKMLGYVKEVRPNSPQHQDRWARALLALEYPFPNPKGLEPMSLSEMKTYRDRGWKRWIPVVAALEAGQKGRSTPKPGPKKKPDNAPPPPPKPVPLPTQALRARIEADRVDVTPQQVATAMRMSDIRGLQAKLLDGKSYTALSMETWMAILEWSDVDRVIYVAEQRDCDNFAIALAGQVALRLGVNGVGIVLDYSGGHAYNCLLVKDTAKGGCYLRLVEPQSDRMPQVGDRLSGHEAYQATRGEVIFA